MIDGFGTLWIEKSRLLLRSCGGGITAWKGTNTTFENKYGVYIHDSDVVKANSSLDIRHECALGRPWNAQHRSIFSECYLDDSILPAGYIEWSASDPRINYSEYLLNNAACDDCVLTVAQDTTMAEFRDHGPGFNATARREASNVTIEMTEEEYAPFSSPEKVFQFAFSGEFGNTAWIDAHPQV